jgi:uncharacterized protein (DUF2141 family)
LKAQTPQGIVVRLAAALLAVGLAQALAAPARADDCSASEAKLDVTVEGLRNQKGLVTYTLYPDDKKKFLAKGGSLERIRVDAHTPATETCVPLPKPGTYLLAVYHDEDANRKLNRSLIGLPREGFGFSNNASSSIGLPAFEAVRFVAKAGVTALKIKLRYLTGKEKLPDNLPKELMSTQ